MMVIPEHMKLQKPRKKKNIKDCGEGGRKFSFSE